MSEFSDAIDHARRQWSGDSEHLPPLEQLHAAASTAPHGASLTELLSADELALIVEPKRATADRGTINPGLDVAATTAECDDAGAHAMSIVTEPILSGGSIDDLRAARSACSMPLIARDLIVDARQAYVLRAAGADALLVPMWLHADEPATDPDAPRTDSLQAIIAAAHSVGLEVVLSIQNERELEAVLDTDADALNIDNRRRDGIVDVERTFELLADVPVGWPVISESIADLDQVARLHHAGVDALLLDEGHLDIGLARALAIYTELSLD